MDLLTRMSESTRTKNKVEHQSVTSLHHRLHIHFWTSRGKGGGVGETRGGRLYNSNLSLIRLSGLSIITQRRKFCSHPWWKSPVRHRRLQPMMWRVVKGQTVVRVLGEKFMEKSKSFKTTSCSPGDRERLWLLFTPKKPRDFTSTSRI